LSGFLSSNVSVVSEVEAIFGEYMYRGVYLFRKPNFQLSHILA